MSKQFFRNHSIIKFILIYACSPLLLFAFESNSAVAADSVLDDVIRVDSIVIKGNDITQDFIILRELTFKKGDVISKSDIEYNRERIFSLNLFSKVEIYPKETNGYSIVFIDVNESWYIYPIPFISKSNGAKKYSYGLHLTYKNFRGRNEVLRSTINFGYDPFFTLLYDNPAFQYDENIGISFALAYQKISNKSNAAKLLYGGDFNNIFYSTALSLSKRLNQFNKIYVAFGFDYVTFPSNNIFGISASSSSIDRTVWLSSGYEFDSRDLKQFSQEGIYSSIQFTHKGFGIDNISYNILRIEFQEHKNIYGDFIGRFKIATRSTFGRIIPYYDYSYLGYSEYVRGHINDYKEGYNSILTSVEFSYPLLKEWDLSLKIPLLPRKLTSARIGIYITTFADAGATYNYLDKIKFNDFYSGYGLGITLLILPYNAIRFEYAVNELGKGEFIIGTGFAF
ncbi:POTRA domain-containing protein [Melioribacteraceae bacterium 4301-Me]|uniref:POTRA domain-containing protein n=1 Tax=Pyranulibacter aquaticus TaxID=3163344 RepID=UPI0035952B71